MGRPALPAAPLAPVLARVLARVLALVLGLASGLAACAAPRAEAAGPVVHVNPVVRVRFTARRPSDRGLEILRARGSGFLVGHEGRGLVVTSHHGIDLRGYDDATYMVIVDEGAPTERTYPARLLHHDIGGDVAVLALLPPFGALPALTLADDAVPGEPVRALGYPHHGAFRETRGTVVAIRPATLFRSAMVEADAPVEPGNSGGPLVDVRGQVVGVVVRSNGRVLHAVPVSYLRRRLRQWHVDAD